MACKIKMNTHRLKLITVYLTLPFLLHLIALNSFAQDDKKAVIKLSFSQTDTTKTCKATVFSDSSLPVKGIDVHLYAKRMYCLLPIGKAVTTDEKGEADISFPMNLPGDAQNMIVLVAKIEGDAVYGNVQTESSVKWGARPTNEVFDWSNRSLSASREKAPMFLVITSVVIIMGIWGTILYLVFQLFRIRQAGTRMKKLSGAGV